MLTFSIFSVLLGSYRITWDAKRFGAGVYFVRLSTGGSDLCFEEGYGSEVRIFL